MWGQQFFSIIFRLAISLQQYVPYVALAPLIRYHAHIQGSPQLTRVASRGGRCYQSDLTFFFDKNRQKKWAKCHALGVGALLSESSPPTRRPIYIMISLAIRQCAAWSSTLITHNFTARRKPLGNKRKPMHQVYLSSVPTFDLSTPFAVLAPSFSLRSILKSYQGNW